MTCLPAIAYATAGLSGVALAKTGRFPALNRLCRGVARQSEDWPSWGLELPAAA